MVEKQAENGMVLVQQYRGVMVMIQQNYIRRTATNGTDNLTCTYPENLAFTFMRLPYSILKTHLS